MENIKPKQRRRKKKEGTKPPKTEPNRAVVRYCPDLHRHRPPTLVNERLPPWVKRRITGKRFLLPIRYFLWGSHLQYRLQYGTINTKNLGINKVFMIVNASWLIYSFFFIQGTPTPIWRSSPTGDTPNKGVHKPCQFCWRSTWPVVSLRRSESSYYCT